MSTRPHRRTTGTSLHRAGLIATVLTMGLAAGFFSTYQWSVVRGLARVDDATYIRAFQAINDTVRTPWFAVVFFGAALFATATTALGLIARVRPLASWLGAAATAVYVAGVLVITFVGNMPRNDDLALVTDPAEFAGAREAFESGWNDLNLVRATTATAAFAVALAALVVSRGRRRL